MGLKMRSQSSRFDKRAERGGGCQERAIQRRSARSWAARAGKLSSEIDQRLYPPRSFFLYARGLTPSFFLKSFEK
jgi:hypothetical protein